MFMRYTTLLLAVALVLGGCTIPETPKLDTETVRNFTLMVECADSGRLPVKISGDAKVDVHDFLKSNCSLNVADGVVTVRCPNRI